MSIKEGVIMKKTLRVGTNVEGGAVEVEVELRQKQSNDKGPTVSFVGNSWQRNRHDIISGGQMQDRLREECVKLSVPEEKLNRILELWNRWHLNDMHAGCEHQRALGWGKEKLEVPTWKLTKEAIREKTAVKDRVEETLRATGQVQLTAREQLVFNADYSYRGEVPPASDLYLVEQVENKLSGWVYPWEHHQGVLTKLCPECGYKYGSAWVYEPIPADVVKEIEAL